MEEIYIINKLIEFLVKNGIKMENIELNLVKNKLTFKKNKKEYTLQLSKKY